MYLKLSFGYSTWCVPGCGGGGIATLLNEPELMDKLPYHIRINHFKSNIHSFFHHEIAEGETFFHDCGYLNQEQIARALLLFKANYDDFKKGLPACAIGDKGEYNEILVNLEIALENAVNPPHQQKNFINHDSAENEETLLTLLMS